MKYVCRNRQTTRPLGSHSVLTIPTRQIVLAHILAGVVWAPGDYFSATAEDKWFEAPV